MLDYILQLLEGRKVRIVLDMTISLDEEPTAPPEPPSYSVSCDSCEWVGNGYKSMDSALRAKRAHQQHCPVYAEQMQWIAALQDAESRKG